MEKKKWRNYPRKNKFDFPLWVSILNSNSKLFCNGSDGGTNSSSSQDQGEVQYLSQLRRSHLMAQYQVKALIIFKGERGIKEWKYLILQVSTVLSLSLSHKPFSSHLSLFS